MSQVIDYGVDVLHELFNEGGYDFDKHILNEILSLQKKYQYEKDRSVVVQEIEKLVEEYVKNKM